MRFPVVAGKKWSFPQKALCPICRKNKVWEPHSMAVLSVGALKVNRKRNAGGPSNELDGFFNMYWHGAHDEGEGKDRDIGALLEVVQDAYGGQSDIYFCSTRCMRIFLNRSVDELELRIRREKKHSNHRLHRTRRPRRARVR